MSGGERRGDQRRRVVRRVVGDRDLPAERAAPARGSRRARRCWRRASTARRARARRRRSASRAEGFWATLPSNQRALGRPCEEPCRPRWADRRVLLRQAAAGTVKHTRAPRPLARLDPDAPAVRLDDRPRDRRARGPRPCRCARRRRRGRSARRPARPARAGCPRRRRRPRSARTRRRARRAA